MKKFYVLLAGIILAFGMLGGPAHADEHNEPCVPKDAYVEVINHPAVTEEIEHEAVPPVTETIPAQAGVWANWSPNNTQGPQDYTPIWPEDERGTWNVHNEVPPGHAGPDGVYQQGEGNSPWFYRKAAVPEKVVVITPGKDAWTEVKTIKEVWTERIEHDAVVCDDKPRENPKPPVDKPPVDKPENPGVDSPKPENPQTVSQVKRLPNTGAEDYILPAALGFAAVGAGIYLLRRQRS